MRNSCQSKFAGWPMGLVAPLFPPYLFIPGLRSVFYERARKLAMESLTLFAGMRSFDDYLKFLQTHKIFALPKKLAYTLTTLKKAISWILPSFPQKCQLHGLSGNLIYYPRAL